MKKLILVVIIGIVCLAGCTLSGLSFKVDDADAVIDKLLKHYGDAKLNTLDGYRFDYPDWWFIIRKSGTEPLIRLVAEAETAELLKEKTEAIVELIE